MLCKQIYATHQPTGGR